MDKLKGFVLYEKQGTRRSKGRASVSIQKAGNIAFNKKSVEDWGIAPDFVRLLFNPETKQVAMVPTDAIDGPGRIVNWNENGSAWFRAVGFLNDNGIFYDVLSQYVPEFEYVPEFDTTAMFFTVKTNNE